MPIKPLLNRIFAFLVISFHSLSVFAMGQLSSDEADATIMEASKLRTHLVETLIILVVAYIINFLIVQLINQRVNDVKTRHIIRKNVGYVIAFVSFNFIVFNWVQDIKSLSIILGVASAGLALALQEVIMCIAGWLFILFRKPFEIGDRIELNGVKGDIIDIRIFQTTMLEIGNWVNADQSTGRIVNIPNSFVFKGQNYNYSRGFEFIWDEMPILVTFESDWKKARDVIMTVAKRTDENASQEVERKIKAMADRYMIYYGKLTPICYVKIEDSGILLTLRYLTEAKKRRFKQNQLSTAILEEFDNTPGIDFAYPTYRITKE